MEQRYAQWIKDNVKETYGQCGNVTLSMQQAFPELRRVRGRVVDACWGVRNHWWLMAGDVVVDPTAAQFPCLVSSTYEELEDGDRIPSGLCADCGEVTYDGEEFCNDTCADSYVRYLNSSLRG